MNTRLIPTGTLCLCALLLIGHAFGQNAHQTSSSNKELRLLDLSFQDLDTIPTKLDLTTVHTLKLNHNNLTSVAYDWQEALLLEEVNLGGNLRIELDEFWQDAHYLRSLKTLEANDCALHYISPRISKLRNLQELDLSDNLLLHLPIEVGDLAKLETLNLANNKLRVLQFQLTRCQQLQQIDLSYNEELDLENAFFKLAYLGQLKRLDLDGAKSLPKALELVSSLEELYVRNGEFEVLPSRISKLKRLRLVDLEGCNKLDVSAVTKALIGVKSLEELRLVGDNINDFPQGLKRMENLKRLVIGGFSFDVRNHPRDHLPVLDELHITQAPNLRGFFIGCLPMRTKLQTLRVTQCELTSLDEGLTEMVSLRELDLSNNELIDLPLDLADLQDLEVLDLRGNPISQEVLDEWQEKLPNCRIEADEPIAQLALIAPPSAVLDIPSDTFVLDAGANTSIRQATGSRVHIPKDAFLDADGNVVEGDVEVYYREFNDPMEIALSGITMQYKEGRQSGDFMSAGMLEINASQDGEPLTMNPDEPIWIELASNRAATDYNLYYLDQEEGWRVKGRDRVDSIKGNEKKPRRVKRPKTPEGPVEPQTVFCKERLHLDASKSKSTRQGRKRYVFQISGSGKSFFQSGRHVERFEFRDVKQVGRKTWVYDGDDAVAAFEKLDSLEKTARRYRKLSGKLKRFERRFGSAYDYMQTRYGPTVIHDVSVAPNPEADNFLVQLVALGDTHSFPAIPLTTMRSAKSEQGDHERFFKRYARDHSRRKEEWGTLESEQVARQKVYKEKVKKYRKEWLRYRADMEKFNLANGESVSGMQADQNTVMRSFALDGLGFWNCDRLINNQNRRQVLADFRDQEGKKVRPKQVYVLDMDRIGVIGFYNTKKLLFDNAVNNALLIFTKDGRVAVVGAEQFTTNCLETDSPSFSLQLVDEENITVQELRKQAGL